MTMDLGGAASHPHFVDIPDASRVEGVRAYREPAEPRPLQIEFLEAAGERAWVDAMRDLLSRGCAAEAETRLIAALDGFDGALARLCKATSAGEVALEGWEDLMPILAEWEGPPITAITLGLTNPPDLVFEAGRTTEPELLLGLYSDEAFPFSRTNAADLLAECRKELPAWAGGEEDVEFYCGISGLAELNTALIHCKHRHFLRDGRDGVEGRAPGGYVEYVLGSWLLATRFLQAAEHAIADHGLPAGCRLILGTVDINADFVTILGDEKPSSAILSAKEPATLHAGFATLSMKPGIPRENPTIDAPSNGPTLRQRLVRVDEPTAQPPRRNLLQRLFGRLRRR